MAGAKVNSIEAWIIKNTDAVNSIEARVIKNTDAEVPIYIQNWRYRIFAHPGKW